MEHLEHLLACLAGVVLAYMLIFVLKLIWSRWQTVSIFVNPETSTSLEIKERNGRYRYYVNMFRVTQRIYDWFWQRNIKKLAEENGMGSSAEKERERKDQEYFANN